MTTEIPMYLCEGCDTYYSAEEIDNHECEDTK